jgi:type VI protein secretion system component Hcp
MKARLPTLCASALLLTGPFAQAANFAFLQATDLPGGSADPAFSGWIALDSIGLTGPLRSGVPGMLSLYKQIDKATAQLAKRCANGQHIKDAKLVLRTASPPDNPAVICVISMSDLLVSSIDVALDAETGEMSETVALKFSRIHFRYFAQDGSEEIASLSLGLNQQDKDGDRMPDAWENYYGLAAGLNNATEDLDGDGLTDLQEFQLGTNPTSGDSPFSAAATIVPGDPNNIEISWDAVPGVAYVIEWSPDLLQTFEPQGGNRVADTSAMKVRLPKSGPTGFFRVRPAGS